MASEKTGQLSKRDSEAILLATDRWLCRDHFYYFVRRAWNEVYTEPFKDGWHIAAMCYHFQAIYDKKAWSKHGDPADTLVLNISSGCGKSRICSVMFSAWVWAKDPNAGQWFASFGYNTIDRDALATRQLIESDWYRRTFWPDVQLTDDQNQKRRYNNTKGGWRLAASISSKTGFGEHPAVLLVDDPHDPQQALGNQREIAIEAWDNKYASRGIISGVAKYCVGQRLGEGDLSGHILESEDDVVHLMIPMWLEEGRRCKTDIEYYDIDEIDENGNFTLKRGWVDPRQKEGELMWPEVMTEKKVDKTKRRLRTAHKISAQMKQNPTAPEGDMFQSAWLNYVDAPPTHGVAIRAWDKASTTGRRSDFTAGALWVYDGDYFYLCDIRRGKWEMKEREEFIMEIAKADAGLFADYTLVFEQSPSGDGKDAAQMQAAKFVDAGFRVRIDRPSTNKPVRAEPMADTMSAGRVKIVRGEWNKKFESELLAFPEGSHDDQVDAAAMGINKAMKSVRFNKIRRPLLLLTPDEREEMENPKRDMTDFEKYLSVTETEERPTLGVDW